MNITYADTDRGRGPTGTAIRTGATIVAKHILTDPNYEPWRAEATKHGYASSIALPLLMDKQAFGALNIYAGDPDAFDPEEVNLLVQLADNLAYGIKALRMGSKRKRAEEELRKSREQLRNLSGYLQSSREQERTSIAREIHDELGQNLTALKMDLSWLEKKLNQDHKSMISKTQSMSILVDKTIQTVKRISTTLRPSILDDFGILAAIEWQAEDFQTRTGIASEVVTDTMDAVFAEELSTAIFRIFQESLTNVSRHAGATKVLVSFKEEEDTLRLTIEDNGRGIKEDEIVNSRSFGIIGIRERVHILGGEVEIRGIPNKGTTVKVNIPLEKTGGTQ